MGGGGWDGRQGHPLATCHVVGQDHGLRKHVTPPPPPAPQSSRRSPLAIPDVRHSHDHVRGRLSATGVGARSLGSLGPRGDLYGAGP